MDAAILIKLAALKNEPKFVDEPGTIYNGMRPEDIRQAAEDLLNDLIERLMQEPRDRPAKEFVLAQFAETLDLFPAWDTEDRERMCHYLAEIAEILSIKGYGGLFNRWMYGFDPGTQA